MSHSFPLNDRYNIRRMRDLLRPDPAQTPRRERKRAKAMRRQIRELYDFQTLDDLSEKAQSVIANEFIHQHLESKRVRRPMKKFKPISRNLADKEIAKAIKAKAVIPEGDWLDRYYDARKYNWEKSAESRRARVVQRINEATEVLRNNPNSTERIRYSALDLGEIPTFMKDIEPLIQNPGDFIVINTGRINDGLHFTLSSGNYSNVLEQLTKISEGEDVSILGSDAEVISLILNSPEFFVTRMRNTGQRTVRRARSVQDQGSMFQYTHSFPDTDPITEVLARLGCYNHIDQKNYVDNCLIIALRGQIDDVVLEEFMSSCLRRQIPMKKLKEIGSKYSIKFIIHSEGASHTRTYGPNNAAKTVELNVYKNHYFKHEKTIYNTWPLKNFDHPCLRTPYGALIDDWYKVKDASGRKEVRGCTTMSLLKTLYEHNHLKEMDISTPGIFGTMVYDRVSTNYSTLEYNEECAKFAYDNPKITKKHINVARHQIRKRAGEENSDKCDELFEFLDNKFSEREITNLAQQLAITKRHKVLPQVFFDFETTTDRVHETKAEYKRHDPYMVCFTTNPLGEEINVEHALGRECGLLMLQRLCEVYGSCDEDSEPEIEMIAHNLTYDVSFIIKYLVDLDVTEKGTSIICGSATFENEGKVIRISFKDSYKMFQCKLADVPKQVGLDSQKEAMPYDLYTTEFVDDRSGMMSDFSELEDYPLIDIVKENVIKWGCYDDHSERIDMIKYALRYCEADVKVLAEGWRRLKVMFLEGVNIDIDAYLTTPAVAHAFMEEMHVYDDVCMVSGTPLHFFAQANIGGRVMTADNERQHEKGRIGDVDVTSLYPHAQTMGKGFPKGKPKVIKSDSDWSTFDYYFVQVKITEVRKKLRFPVISKKNKNGGNDWVNPEVGDIVITDKCTLEQFKEFHGGEYEIIQGYYFDEGFNDKIQEVVPHLFNTRVMYKEAGNPIELTFKCIMNSSYGKNGQKPITTETVYVPPDRLENFMMNHYNDIQYIQLVPNGQIRVRMYKTIKEDFNRQHISAIILSHSKLHMNRAMNVLPHQDHIFYTDTDSLHINLDYYDEMQEAYKNKYGEDMTGVNELGKFHNDFSFKGCCIIEDGKLVRKNIKAVGEIVSREFYGVGKKVYMDELVDETGQVAYHVRSKGVPIESVIQQVNRSYLGGNVKGLYDDLYEGYPLKFQLGGDSGKVMFKTLRDHTVVTTQMKRTLHFPHQAPLDSMF